MFAIIANYACFYNATTSLLVCFCQDRILDNIQFHRIKDFQFNSITYQLRHTLNFYEITLVLQQPEHEVRSPKSSYQENSIAHDR
jgi:hypothetical protein